MPIITKLEPSSGRRGRTNVFLDGGHAAFDLSDPVAAQFGLRAGKDVTDDDVAAMTDAERAYQALQTALTFLEPRMRSRGEIVTRLRRGHFDDAAIEHAVGKLLAMGLIDDAQFAATYVEARARPDGGRPVGRRRLMNDLAGKGVSKEQIAEALETVSDEDEHALALAAARKKVRAVPSDPERRKAERPRLIAFLQRRGFGWDVVKKVADEVLGGNADDEEFD
jgi:regulatory protein